MPLSPGSTRRRAVRSTLGAAAIGLIASLNLPAAARATEAEDKAQLAALDTRYQKAVQDNDVQTMGEILADDFILVEGDGKRSTKADLLADAKSGRTRYDHQVDSQQTVEVSGDTAIVTALLWARGVEDGVHVDYRLWFSDVYRRTPTGWRYYFAQASLPLPHRRHR